MGQNKPIFYNSGDIEAVKTLVQNGANVNDVDTDKSTPLHDAYTKCNHQI